jgi:hypothetical protein
VRSNTDAGVSGASLPASEKLLAAPDVGKPGWLPVGFNDELDELAAEHERLLSMFAELSEESAPLHTKFRQEDDARDEALKRYARGEQVTFPEVTPQAQRDEVFAPIRARTRQLRESLSAHVQVVLDACEANADSWMDALREQDAADDMAVQEALRAVAVLEDGRRERHRLARWIDRASGHRWSAPRARIIAFGAVEVGTDDARLRELRNRVAGLLGDPPERVPTSTGSEAIGV